jgi:hypothetical protein
VFLFHKKLPLSPFGQRGKLAFCSRRSLKEDKSGGGQGTLLNHRLIMETTTKDKELPVANRPKHPGGGTAQKDKKRKVDQG